MNINLTRSIILVLASWATSAHAQEGSVSITPGDKAREVVVTVKNGPTNCGMEVRFGDGRDTKKRLEANETWTVKHSYKRDGNFGIEAEGVLVIRGLRTAGACAFGSQAVMSIAGDSTSLQAAKNGSVSKPVSPASRGTHQDMVLMVRTAARSLKFTKTIDGERRIANGQDLALSGTSLCIVKFPNAYGEISDDTIDAVASNSVRQKLMASAQINDVRLNRVSCIEGTGNDARFTSIADLVLVQRQALPLLVNGSPEFAQGYETFHELAHLALFDQAAEMLADQARRKQAVAQRLDELDSLAQSGSVDKVGSLAFGLPQRSGPVRFCTLSYDGQNGAAILGYAQRGFSTQSEAFQAQAQRAQATLSADRPFAKVYANIDALYQALQTGADDCRVYVDFPANLKKLLTALQRDKKGAPVINQLISSADLRDDWAKKIGFQNYAEHETARDMKVTAQQFKALATYAIADAASFDAAVQEMQASQYSSSSNPADLISYLRDKEDAAGKPGATAISIREARQQAAREAAAANAAAERRRLESHAKEYPFIAVLTCGMPDHINIVGCFVGGKYGVDTELTLKNGSNSAMYKVYNLQQAGEERRDGFYIDLKRNFEIRAQNADDTLILGLKVIDRLSGKVLYQKQAARFGVVAVKN